MAIFNSYVKLPEGTDDFPFAQLTLSDEVPVELETCKMSPPLDRPEEGHAMAR